MIDQYFDDPRHRRSEELVFDAEDAERRGDLQAARDLFREAAALEEAVGLSVRPEHAKMRSLLAVGAVTLWLRAESWDEAARAACTFLAVPDALLPEGYREIQTLLDRAWRAREMVQAIGGIGAFASVEMRMSGGRVGFGITPMDVLTERREIVRPLLLRIAEWIARKPFRKAGPSALARQLELFELPAMAGSYVYRVGIATRQQVLEGAGLHPKEIVGGLLSLADVAGDAEALAGQVPDVAYRHAFLRGIRDLAADGDLVGDVHLAGFVAARPHGVSRLPATLREHLTQSLRPRPVEQPVERSIRIEGVLKSVNLRGQEPKIGIETAEGMRTCRIERGEHDDTIGPKLNRRVQVLGMWRPTEDGSADDWADDVILLEGEPLPPRPEPGPAPPDDTAIAPVPRGRRRGL